MKSFKKLLDFSGDNMLMISFMFISKDADAYLLLL